MRRLLLVSLLVAIVVSTGSSQDQAAYKDVSLTPEKRASDLVSRMTLEEKVGQMQNAAPAIPRLGIPAYDWWNEALHGVARAGLATVFPQAIGLAATWDTDLEHRIADTISTEARAKYNDAIRHDDHRRYRGLTFWSPNINIFRDPRWGRGQETYGEDPFLAAQMALAFIKGIQGNHERYLKAIATSKHFAVHSGPESSRHSFNVNPSPRDLADTYLYAFRKTLASGGAESVMCAYNSIDGAPACANVDLLQKDLRQAWGFKGYVVSDCGAVGDIFRGHHYADSMAKASALAVQAGTDLDCGTEYRSLVTAVHEGYITEAEITRSVERLFAARFRLGMFDPPERVPFSRIGMDQLASPAHGQVALEAAQKAIVLLKNDGLLPLRSIPKKIAVVGPAADDPDALLGNYNGTPSHIVTPLEGIAQKFKAQADVQFVLGSTYTVSSAALVPSANLQPRDNANEHGATEHGVSAEYFNNDSFEGKPVLSRLEPRLYFSWETHDPAIASVVPNPTFSARWQTTLRVTESGEYELGLAHQECDSCIGSVSMRLYLNGQPLVDESRRAASGNQTFKKVVHLDAGTSYALRVEYAQRGAGPGLELVWTPPADQLLREAVRTVEQSELVILCLGLNSRLEGEESPIDIPGFSHGDRTDINLPAPQQKLLNAILETGKPTVVVLVNGSALAVIEAKQKAQAIVETWYGGQDGGTALANTLAGDNNPAGRLPVTFYDSVGQLPPFDDYAMAGRTYRFFTGKPLYPFGFGLSYSDFRYDKLALTRVQGKGLEVATRVTNRSHTAGDEVVQLYLSSAPTTGLQLSGFMRLHLQPGESKPIRFSLADADLNGKAFVSVGGGQPIPEWTGGHYVQEPLPAQHDVAGGPGHAPGR